MGAAEEIAFGIVHESAQSLNVNNAKKKNAELNQLLSSAKKKNAAAQKRIQQN